MTAESAFYERLDESRWRPTDATRGPWSFEHQHAGPPSALVGTVLADVLGPGRIVRCTFEILRPVPIVDLTTAVEVIRPGHKVALAQATLADDAGPVMLARAWRLREAEVDLGPDLDADAALPSPDEAEHRPFFPVEWDEGYHRAVEVRFVDGAFNEPGDATAWLRCTIPLVSGTELTPLQRLLVASDTGNGISARLDVTAWLFANTDLTVHVRDMPSGDWVGLDARTRFGPDGIGLATATIHGEQGPIGTALQSLLVEPR